MLLKFYIPVLQGFTPLSLVSFQTKKCQVTISKFLACACPDFINTPLLRKWVHCKHLYFLFCDFMNVHIVNDKHIHHPTFSTMKWSVFLCCLEFPETIYEVEFRLCTIVLGWGNSHLSIPNSTIVRILIEWSFFCIELE